MPPTFNLQEEINKASANTMGSQSLPQSAPAGAYQYSTGGQATMQPPTLSAYQQPTPVATSTPVVPTRNVATELERIKNEALAIQGKLNSMQEPTVGQTLGIPNLEKDTPFQSTNLTDREQEAIRRNQLKLYQREIDATNQVYDQMLREAKVQGQGRLGSTTALGARSGILGSDFAQAQTDTVNTYNRQINSGIGAERAAKIANIMGTARQAAVDEIAAKNAARKQDADALIQWHKNKSERRTKNLETLATSMLQQGINPTELDTKTLNDIAKSYGITKEDVAFAYNTAKSESEAAASKADLETRKTESEIAKNGRFNLSEGQGMYDAEGNLLASRAKTYAPSTGTATDIPETISSSIRQTLESNRGPDKYTDTGKYLAEYEDFVNAGGTPEQFLKNFDPDIYINPADPTRSWLESQMKKESTDPFAAFFGGGSSTVAPTITPAEEESAGWWSSLTGNG